MALNTFEVWSNGNKIDFLFKKLQHITQRLVALPHLSRAKQVYSMRLLTWTFLLFDYRFKSFPFNKILVKCQPGTVFSYDVIACDLWFGTPPPIKTPGYAYAM